jgi:DNA-binding CsgD family transcriptional regulator
MLTKSQKLEELAGHVAVWMNNDTRARFIVNDDLAIRWMNDAALHIIGALDIFDMAKSRLEIRDSKQFAAFRLFVRLAGPHSTSMWIKCSPESYILCTAIALSDNGNDPATGLILRPTIRAPNLDGVVLQAEYRLTTAERRVVEELFGGQTAEEVADQLGISVGTVRAHIRHIYDKLDVGSREAMFHKLLPFTSDV